MNQYIAATILASTALLRGVSAHGYITSPQARVVGDAMKAACGQQIYNQQLSDINGNIQGELQNVQSDYNAQECHIWQCKGFQFDDNKANVQTYSIGQSVPIHFDIRAPHTGTANISVVDTATDKIIGQPMKSWDVFASTSTPIQADQTDFSVTIPDLGGKCTTPGACVIQMFWDARSIDQTYESCIDFVVGGSGNGSGSGSTPSSSRQASSIAISTTPAAVTNVQTITKATTTTAPPTTSVSTGAGFLVTSGSKKLMCYEDL